MTPVRRRVVLALVGGSVLAAGLLPPPLPGSIVAAPPVLDVTAADATAAAIEVTAQDAYSFVFDPDVQLPRATASIAADRARATASPADPGDQVDALPGTAIPLGEGMAVAGVQGAAGRAPQPLPSVFAAGATALGTAFTTLGPATAPAGVPFEHVVAVYPDPGHAGASSSTFGTDPQVADPTGLLALEGAARQASAGPGAAVADAGGGAAVTAAALGFRVGRLASHAESRTFAGRVVADAWSEVDGLDVGAGALGLSAAVTTVLGGATVLHADVLRTDLHAERTAGAAATGHATVSATGVTVLGHAARVDSSGIHVDGAGVELAPVVAAVNALLDRAATVDRLVPDGGPTGRDPVVPIGHFAGPVSATSTTHSGDQATALAAGLTLTVRATVLVPASTAIPPPPGPPQLSPTPVTLQVVLASARVRAYGRTLPPPPVVAAPAAALGGTPPHRPDRATAAGGAPTAGVASVTAPNPAPTAPVPSATGAAVRRAGGLPAGLVVTVAAAAQLAILGALAAARGRARPGAAPAREWEDLP